MKPVSAALYMRLSKDDEGALESVSIQNQRKMLYAYAKEQGFPVYSEYIDDGYSGTNFDRPGFLRMIADIEAGLVNLVLTKDLSRLGRDYITAGQYTEIYFPSKGVRYIAVNDGYDSQSPYKDMIPFKHVMNEMVARDTSRKIRSAFLARMKEGDFIGNFAPYGYQKDPLNKHHLLPDPEAGKVVKEIFSRAARGESPSEIANALTKEGLLPPLSYRTLHHPSPSPKESPKDDRWRGATISKMLQNEVYLGHMIQGKTYKPSFKSPVTLKTPAENQIKVLNTHEPLITPEEFAEAKRHLKRRTCHKQGSFQNIFSGLAFCADCGKPMSAVGSRKKGALATLVCGAYKAHGKEACTNHAIDYSALLELVQAELKEAFDVETASLWQFNALTPSALFSLMDRIEIGQGYYEGRVKHQSVALFFRASEKPHTENNHAHG